MIYETYNGKCCSENGCYKEAIVSNGVKDLCKRHYWDYCKMTNCDMNKIYSQIWQIENIRFTNWVMENDKRNKKGT